MTAADGAGAYPDALDGLPSSLPQAESPRTSNPARLATILVDPYDIN
ncbi:MAG: hypothetical protein ACR2JG_10325 [Geodermatophilaceae bacterium]